MKIAFYCLLGFFSLLALGWVATANDWALSAVWMPKMEQVRRNTFEQSVAYNQGMIQDLYGMQVTYSRTDEKHKDALASIILHRYSTYSDLKLPPDLQAFMLELRHREGLE